MLPLKQSLNPVGLIRFALIAGVVLFGATIVFVHSQPSWKAAALPSGVGNAQAAVAVIAVLFAIALRGRVMRAADPQRRDALLLTGWAVGEGAALFGGAIFLLTGHSQWYFLGLLSMAATFVALRIPPMP